MTFEDIRKCVGEVQRRADAEVVRCTESVRYYAARIPETVDAMTTGATLGLTGTSKLAREARALDLANAQAAAVRNVWLALHSKFGES